MSFSIIIVAVTEELLLRLKLQRAPYKQECNALLAHNTIEVMRNPSALKVGKDICHGSPTYLPENRIHT